MKTILMVEDDPLIGSVYGRRLRVEGYKFSAISDAEGALGIMENKMPDLLLVDLTLPGMDGINLIHRVRKMGATLPIIVLTSAYSAENIDAAYKAGANECLCKSGSNPGRVFEAVAKILDPIALKGPPISSHSKEPSSVAEQGPTATTVPTVSRTTNGFRGVLRQVELTDVVQFSCLARQTGLLTVRSGTLRGSIYLEEGKITHAVCGRLTGEAAFESLIGLHEGDFDLQPNAEAPSERSINQPWEFLIMEAARKRDESASTSDKTPLALAATVRGEMVIQCELRRGFLAEATGWIDQLRGKLKAVDHMENGAMRVAALTEIYQRVRAIAANAALAEIAVLANIASAFEAFLDDLCKRSQNITPSTLRTVAMALEFLDSLLHTEKVISGDPHLSANVLAVDDEPLSRWAVARAMEKAHLKCISLDSPQIARDLLRENKFDLVVLDIDMPEIGGLTLCREMRSSTPNEHTPVIFVTSMGDFESYAQSVLAGGNDLIAKPFLPLELGLKALIYLQKSQLLAAPNPIR